jgi:uncharacterized protein YjbJ (UPF0337 family)
MGIVDKVSNKIQDLKGRGKETWGRAAGDSDLEIEGKADQVKAAVKDVGETVKEAGTKAKRMVNP